MNTSRCLFILITLSLLSSCNKGQQRSREDEHGIQREEALDADDLRETDSYDRNVPVDEEDEYEDSKDAIGN